MISINVPNFDKMRDELNKALNKLNTDKFITVGVHESDNARGGDSMTNARLGAIQHYGNDHIPARPWLDTGVASGTPNIVDTISDGLEDGLEMDQILNRVGVVAVAAVQDYMTEIDTPPNAPSTIAKKGSANPLIDTGELKQSVTYDITNSKPSEGL